MKQKQATLLKIYQRLLRHFGHQGWWPTTPSGQTHPVYHTNGKARGPLTAKERFEICVGAILTQNTAWKNVEKAIAKLNLHKVKSPQAILNLPQGKLQDLIRSSGFFRQKTSRLKVFSHYLIQRYKGRWSRFLHRNLPETRRKLLSLTGIGPETADSILLYAGARPVFVMDAYTRRIMLRVYGRKLLEASCWDYHGWQSFFHQHLPKKVSLFQDFHAQFVALGKEFCKPKPICDPCPLNSICEYAGNRRKPR